MPRARKLVPSYLPFNAAKTRARAVWRDAAGRRQYRLLPGPFNSPESLSAFARLQAELAASPAGVAPPSLVSSRGTAGGATPGRTLAEVMLAFLKHAEAHYRGPDGKHTSEFNEYRLVCRAVRPLYGSTPADDFGPLALKAMQRVWLDAGLARSEINRRSSMLRRLFKWAAGEELIRFAVYHRLTAVTGLQKGRTPARETEPVGPVDDATVDATLPFLTRHVRGVIEFQRLTGCRPGEACRVRPADTNMTAPVWLYRPPHHKNTHRGKPRVVAIGPKAQALLAKYTPADPTAYYFSPAAAVAEQHAARSANRKTKRFPSHMARNACKRVATPKRPPAARYTPMTVSRAVSRAIVAANKRRERMAGVGNYDPLPYWHPNQLRHSHATVVRRRFGLEAAQAALGHAKADVTQIYAERNTALAATVAAALG